MLLKLSYNLTWSSKNILSPYDLEFHLKDEKKFMETENHNVALMTANERVDLLFVSN